MELAIRMARRAAPAVQGEPVAFRYRTSESAMWNYVDWRGPDEVEKDNFEIQYLIAAPQPAEQQPSADDSLTPVPDELFAAEFSAWWEQHGQFCRSGGGEYERTFAFEAWRHLYPKLMKLQKVAAEQQPAPDVAGLVEALESLLRHAKKMGRTSALYDKARAALAAQRKQGGEI